MQGGGRLIRIPVLGIADHILFLDDLLLSNTIIQKRQASASCTFILVGGDDLNDVGANGGRFQDFTLKDVGQENWLMIIVILNVDHYSGKIALRRRS